MKDREIIQSLKDLIESNLAVLSRIERYCRDFVEKELPPQGKRAYYHAVVLADCFERYYTCLETIFMRISQHFENNLDPARWHRNLLENMRLRIEGVRERVVSEEAYPLLVEFLKFRHFKRYYFDIDYDWDKMDYLRKKFESLVPLIQRDIGGFLSFLDRLLESL